MLEKHYRPGPDSSHGPSWLTFIGHLKDSLWSVDFFRCESILLNTHWVLVVMDQFTRRIIDFGVHAGDVDGDTPAEVAGDTPKLYTKLKNFRWQTHCRGLYQLPEAA